MFIDVYWVGQAGKIIVFPIFHKAMYQTMNLS